MCFAPQRRALFRHLNLQKWSEPLVLLTFWLRNVLRATTACTFSTSQLPKLVRTPSVLYILTWKCASCHNGVHFFDISTAKSGPDLVCFVHFDLEMCFAPQRRAPFRHLNLEKWSEPGVFCAFWLGNVLRATTTCTFWHLNFQKWSEPGVFCTFWLGNVLCATTACNFSSLIWPAGSAPAALASLLFDPPEPQIIGKTQCCATFLPFSRICVFFLLTLSLLLFFLLIFLFSLPLPCSAFHLSILSEVWLLNFLRWYFMSHLCISMHGQRKAFPSDVTCSDAFLAKVIQLDPPLKDWAQEMSFVIPFESTRSLVIFSGLFLCRLSSVFVQQFLRTEIATVSPHPEAWHLDSHHFEFCIAYSRLTTLWGTQLTQQLPPVNISRPRNWNEFHSCGQTFPALHDHFVSPIYLQTTCLRMVMYPQQKNNFGFVSKVEQECIHGPFGCFLWSVGNPNARYTTWYNCIKGKMHRKKSTDDIQRRIVGFFPEKIGIAWNFLDTRGVKTVNERGNACLKALDTRMPDFKFNDCWKKAWLANLQIFNCQFCVDFLQDLCIGQFKKVTVCTMLAFLATVFKSLWLWIQNDCRTLLRLEQLTYHG